MSHVTGVPKKNKIGGINSLMTQENFPELKDTPTEHTCELYKFSNAKSFKIVQGEDKLPEKTWQRFPVD